MAADVRVSDMVNVDASREVGRSLQSSDVTCLIILSAGRVIEASMCKPDLFERFHGMLDPVSTV